MSTPEDQDELSVTEKSGTYSSMGKPKEDTDVFVGREDLNSGARPDVGAQRRPNRATPDPMAQLREQAKANAPRAVTRSRPRSSRRWLMLAAIFGGTVILITSGVVLLATLMLRPQPSPTDEVPAITDAPAPTQNATDDDLGRVPVRKGLRGE
ncbi:MAG: hypothetical protein KTR31_36945 [Myxococcales bacterium]|nr:hypothetical protein [Myxococcales bacterium]